MNFKFQASVVVEASSAEDALSKIGGRLSVITRHLGNGEKLGDSDPFFKLTETLENATAGALADPIAAARLAAGQVSQEVES